MEIIKVTPRGYCKGVVRAINIAKQTAIEYPDKTIYILGMLVHNAYVIEALKKYNIITLADKQKTREELLDEVSDGVVIFTAHGIHKEIKQKAIDKGLIVVDATCPDVLKTQVLIDDYKQKGFEVLYIGKKFHPEASAICDNNPKVHLIENIGDVQALPKIKKVFVTNQTTMSIYDVKKLFDYIAEQFPDAIFSEEICSATSSRQEAITNLKNVDALIIVGDKASNNSNRLAEIGKSQGIKSVYLVNDVNDLNMKEIFVHKRVAISAGASTPTYLTNQVIRCMENANIEKQMIEIDKIL